MTVIMPSARGLHVPGELRIVRITALRRRRDANQIVTP
jgi:hypothetical protein